MNMVCTNCSKENFVKNGFHKGHQRYKCKDCGYQWTKPPVRNPQETKDMALALWGYSFSVDAITKLLEIDRSTLYRWVKEHGEGISKVPYFKVREFLKWHEDICECLDGKDYKIAQGLLINVRTFKKENEAFIKLIEQQYMMEDNERLIKFREQSHRRLMREMPWLYDGIGEEELRKHIVKKKED